MVYKYVIKQISVHVFFGEGWPWLAMAVTTKAATLHHLFLHFFPGSIFPLFPSSFPIQLDEISQLGSEETDVIILVGDEPIGDEDNSWLQLADKALLLLLAKSGVQQWAYPFNVEGLFELEDKGTNLDILVLRVDIAGTHDILFIDIVLPLQTFDLGHQLHW